MRKVQEVTGSLLPLNMFPLKKYHLARLEGQAHLQHHLENHLKNKHMKAMPLRVCLFRESLRKSSKNQLDSARSPPKLMNVWLNFWENLQKVVKSSFGTI